MKRIIVAVVLLLWNAMIGQSQSSLRKFAEVKHTDRWISLKTKVRLNYTEQGSSVGIPVIFLHGYSDSRISFESMLPYFPASIHAYAISLRGFGDSYKPSGNYKPSDFAEDIAAFMDELKIESAIIVGHSMGSIIAQKFALDYPNKTRALVLISSFISISQNKVAKELSAGIMAMKKVEYSFVKDFQESTVFKKVDSVYFGRLVAESMKVPLHVWQQTINGLMGEDYSYLLEYIPHPVLIIWGDQDQVCSRTEQEELKSALSNSDLIVFQGIGHAPHWEDPQATAKHIITFVEKVTF